MNNLKSLAAALALSALTFAPSAAFARTNIVALHQAGQNNAAAVSQHGQHNNAAILQRGEGHEAVIVQDGNRNRTRVIQTLPTPQSARVTQVGDSNDALVLQGRFGRLMGRN